MARRTRRRRGGLSGWGDRHQGFPWFGVHWAWHVFLIWPAAAWGIARVLYAVRGRPITTTLPSGQQTNIVGVKSYG